MAASKSNRARILVVDDDEDFRTSTQALLESEGYEVLTAADGKQALAAVTSARPDLVVLDIMMSNAFEGYEINQAIKHQPAFAGARDLPILMVSSVQDGPAERFARAGEVDMVVPDHYLTKPLDIPEFLQAVKELLARGRSG